MNIFVSNIPYKATEEELKDLFAEFGEVQSAKIIIDKFSKRSKGFGFVEMSDDNQAQAAIDKLNGFVFMEKNLVVAVARPRTETRGGDNYNRRGNNY